MRWGIEGLEKEWEGVEVGFDSMETHSAEDIEWWLSSRPSLEVGSNEGVPDEGFKGWMSKMKSRVSRGYELCACSHCIAGSEWREETGNLASLL